MRWTIGLAIGLTVILLLSVGYYLGSLYMDHLLGVG